MAAFIPMTVATAGTGASSLVDLQDVAITSPVDSNILAYDAVLQKWKNVPPSAGTVTSISGTAPIQVATGTTTPVISINAATTSTAGSMSGADKTKLDAITGTNTGDQTLPTLSSLGIPNVDNTSDVNKPVSTAQQAALNLKVNAVSPDTSGTLTHTGDIVLSGAGKRITGDLSDAVPGNRLLFQSSVVNGASFVETIPNGTSLQSGWIASNSSTDPANASYLRCLCTGTYSSIAAGRRGAGSYLPLSLSVGGADVATYSEAAATLGNMTASVSRDSSVQYTVANSNVGSSARALLQLQTNSGSIIIAKNSVAGGHYATFSNSSGELVFQSAIGNHFAMYAGGNTLHVNSSGGLGYGAGAGGTVTQTTSKSTEVVINRPCGSITMHNASLAANSAVVFILRNSIIVGTDNIKFSIAGTGTYAAYIADTSDIQPGLAVCFLRNLTAAPLAEAVYLRYTIIKGSNS